jgi:hypothetical protein
MPPIPRPDEDVDLLLAERDPINRAALSDERVMCALDRLHDAIVREPARQPRLNVRRPPRKLMLSAALVGSLAAGVLAVSALLPASGTHEGQLGAAPATAAVLERAAVTAMNQTGLYPTARQYQYLEMQFGGVSGGANPAAHAIVNTWYSELAQDWIKPNDSGRERIIDTGRRFLTPRDQAVARANGESLDSLLADQSFDAANPQAWFMVSAIKPVGLPTEPSALLRAIERRTSELHHGAAINSIDVFGSISQLLFVSDSPQLRAALYRVIEHLPGVQLLGPQTDRIGRQGIGVAIADHGTRDELLFDPGTSDVLQTEAIALASQSYSQGTLKSVPIPRGTVLTYTVFIKRGIVNSIQDLPGGGHLPLHPFGGVH